MKAQRIALFSALIAVAANAGTIYWDGSGTNWDSPANWSTSSSATTPDPAAKPGSADIAVFNIDSVSVVQPVALGADQAATKVTVQGTATGGATITGGGTDRTLSLGTGGMEVLSGAGPLVIGSDATGQGVAVSLAGNQTWTNGSANAVVIRNGVTAPGAQTLTLRGAGGFRLNGPGTYTGGAILTTSTVALGHDSALGTGTFTVNSGTILVEDFPRTLANKVRINSTATSNWSGDGSLILARGDATPVFAITINAAPTINIVNTAPIAITGIYSLCDSTGPNNNPQSPTLASSANLTISADIWESNAGNAFNVNNKGAKFVFVGAGANLTLSGVNGSGDGASSGRSTDIISQPGVGFNTVTIGGPGGPGATIRPFGASALYTNNGQGFYLKAHESGQILGNNISLGASTNNDGGRPIGFYGENDLTLGGSFTLGAGVTFPNLASGMLTFAGTVNCVTNRTLTILGTGPTTFSSTSSITTSLNPWGGLAKLGPGTLTLAGTSDLLGATSLRGGSVVLDYSAGNASRITSGTNTTAALVLGGVDVQLKGGSFTQTLGAGGGTTLDIGHSRIRRTGGGTSTLAIGAITRNNGSLIDVESGVVTTTMGNYLGLLGNSTVNNYATVGESDWATVDGGSIVALSSYDSFAVPGSNKNVLQTGSASLATASVNTLKIVATGSGESLDFTNGGGLTLNRGGLLFTGTGNYTISGTASLVYSTGLTVHHYGSGSLTITPALSGGFVQKGGPGTLVLANAANNHGTMTYLLGGTVSVHAAGCLGAGNLSFNGGTLQTTAGFATSKTVALGGNGGTFQVDADTLELSGVVSGTYGALNKTGAGTLLLSGNNTFAGPVTVSDGTLKFGHVSALGPLNSAATASNRSISPITVMGDGTFDIAGFTPALGNFTLESGTIADSVGGGTLGAYSFTLLEGTVSAVLTNAVVPYASNPSHSITLTKRGDGEAVIASTSLYTGHTFVDGGTLRVNGALPASPSLVRVGGTLGGNGSLSRTVNVEGGTLEPGSSATAPGALTLGRHLRIDGGTLRIVAGPSAHGQVVLTHPEARVLLSDATLAIDTLAGFAAGGELTIIDNQGASAIEGTFADLPEGTAFEADGKRFAITYTGGDGNDVVLAARQTATLLLLR